MKKLFIAKAFVLLMIIAFCSCVTVRENRLMGDVIGFSDDVQTSFEKKPKSTKQPEPFNLLTTKGIKEMDIFIRNIPDGQNTVGYYALDIALDRVKYVRSQIMHNDPETRYYIILLTDGLDNGSTAAAQNHHKGYYKDLDSYIKKIDKKKSTVMGLKNKQNYMQIYPILFTAGDLEKMRQSNNMDDATFDRYVMSMMEGYRGASNGVEKPKPIYGNNLDNLVKEFEAQFAIQGFEFLVPKGYLNKRIRMTMEDLSGNKVSIEGTFSKKGSKFIFKDIKFSEGLISESVPVGGMIKSKNQSEKGSLLSVFMIDNLKLNGKPFKMVKFRSMRVNSPDIRLKDGSTYNGENDPRVTKIGRFLRKSSIDEMPQFINVFLSKYIDFSSGYII